MSGVKIEIEGLDELRAHFKAAPDIVGPILKRGVQALTQAVFKQANRRNVPWDTGTLVKTFRTNVSGLKGEVFPTAKYAAAVHDGYGPRVIKAKPGKALYWPGAPHPVKQVKHPGYGGNPYLDKMADASEPERDLILAQMGNRITNALK